MKSFMTLISMWTVNPKIQRPSLINTIDAYNLVQHSQKANKNDQFVMDEYLQTKFEGLWKNYVMDCFMINCEGYQYV